MLIEMAQKVKVTQKKAALEQAREDSEKKAALEKMREENAKRAKRIGEQRTKQMDAVKEEKRERKKKLQEA